MKWPRVEETIFFPSTEFSRQQTVEVRSRPIWVVVLERWFLEVHELFSHTLNIRIPYKDRYWGEPMEAAFHVFYTWTLNNQTIDRTADYANLKEVRDAQ